MPVSIAATAGVDMMWAVLALKMPSKASFGQWCIFSSQAWENGFSSGIMYGVHPVCQKHRREAVDCAGRTAEGQLNNFGGGERSSVLFRWYGRPALTW